ncbi:MAG: hypothetical protein QOJ51_3507 [Acidobacteriaceae bacterium]|nr:hypothetical protein [Acidobacteriaceae bacterium]
MTNTGGLILTALLAAFTGLFQQAEDHLRTLNGYCSIAASAKETEVDLRLESGACIGNEHCGSTQTQQPLSAFLGFTLADLRREGAHVDAVIRAEAGTITCSGAVHDGKLSGAFRFVPEPAFAARMLQMGYRDLDEEKLQAYTLFRIGIDWIRSLQSAGVSGMNSANLIALRIFHADPDYVHSLNALGYPAPDAEKLVALRVHRVDADEVKQIRALGYQPTLDELIQMRIFNITPAFIHRMQARGLENLTISKLVQIRIFNLAD